MELSHLDRRCVRLAGAPAPDPCGAASGIGGGDAAAAWEREGTKPPRTTPGEPNVMLLVDLVSGGGVGSTKWNWTVGGAQRRAVAASRSPLLPAGCSQRGWVVSVVSVVMSSASSTSSNRRHRQHLQRRQRPDFFQMAWPGRLGEHAPAGPGERRQGVKGGGCIAVPMHAPYRTPSPATCSVDQLAVCPAQAQPSPYVLLRVCGAGGGERGLDRFAG